VEWEPEPDPDINSLTISQGYSRAMVARDLGLLIDEFDLLPWEVQEKHIAFYMARRKVDSYYLWCHEQRAKNA
jgi:hypothetical protein